MGTGLISGLRAPATMARIAGFSWLISVVSGIYAEVFVRGSMIVHGDSAATSFRIMAAQTRFRAGFVADLVGAMSYMVATTLAYAILKPAGRTTALIMWGFGLVGSAVMAANLVNLLAPLVLLDGIDRQSALTPLVLLFLRLHGLGYSISIALFSIQIAAIGVLVWRCGFFPKLFGALFVIEALCNSASCFGGFLDLGWVDRLGSYILLPGLPAEIGFPLWLLVFGVRAIRRRPDEDAQGAEPDLRGRPMRSG